MWPFKLKQYDSSGNLVTINTPPAASSGVDSSAPYAYVGHSGYTGPTGMTGPIGEVGVRHTFEGGYVSIYVDGKVERIYQKDIMACLSEDKRKELLEDIRLGKMTKEL